MIKRLLIGTFLGVVAIGTYSSGQAQREEKNDVELRGVDFPFELMRTERYQPLSTVTWKQRVFIPRAYYSAKNLDCLFRAISKSYSNREENLDVDVYTNREKLNFERRVSGGILVFSDHPKTPDSPAKPIEYDAAFRRTGSNEWYWYKRDLEDPATLTVAVIRGLAPNPPQWHEIERVEISRGRMRVRVTAGEARIEPPTTYFEFVSTCDCIFGWQPIMVFRHKDPVKIPIGQIRFVKERTAYLFMGWMYAVTTNQGNTWSVWDAEDYLKDWECCDYEMIQDVRIEEDGTGTMTLRQNVHKDGVRELRTNDYGRHWN